MLNFNFSACSDFVTASSCFASPAKTIQLLIALGTVHKPKIPDCLQEPLFENFE